MSSSLVHQRCHRHTGREAVARCPACARFWCRECTIEHEGLLLCSECLAAQGTAGGGARKRGGLRWGLLAVAGFLFAWTAFYYTGALLERLPSEFHPEAWK